MEKLSDQQSELIRKVALEYGLEKFEASVDSGSEKGDNFMGILTSITIKEDDKVLHLVLKARPAGNRDDMLLTDVYEKEIFLYDKVFREFDKLQKELKIKHFYNGYPKFCGSSTTDKEEFFAMEDLRQQGFQLWNKKVPMNPDHIEIVLREYAKLHSIGMILKNKNPKFFAEIKKNLNATWDNLGEKFKDFDTGMVKMLFSAVRNNKQATNTVTTIVQKMERYYTDIENDQYHLTITHGDCWCNNFLFKYKDGSSAPSEICILDWQLAKVNSPAADLVYFFFATVGKEQLKNYKYYLKIYHDIVRENLQSVGLDAEVIFPYSLLESHFRAFTINALMAVVMLFHLTLGDKDEAPTIDGKKDAFIQVFETQLINQDEVDQRIVDVVLFMEENDLIYP